MLPIDISGTRAFVAGVADDAGFGFAIAKALAMAGASVCVGTWPPALGIFETLLRRLPDLAPASTQPRFRPMIFLRGPDALPLLFDTVLEA